MQGPIGAKVSKDFPSQLPGLPRPPPFAARRHVDEAGIAEHRAAPILLRDFLGRPLDDQRQLGLVHEDPRLGHLRQHDRVARPDHRFRVLHEHVERPRLALRVLPVIGDAAEDLARPRQRRAQPHRTRRIGFLLDRQPLELRAQRVEMVDDPLHGELRGVLPFDRRRDADDAAIGQQPRHRLVVPRAREQHQLHARLPVSRQSIVTEGPKGTAPRRDPYDALELRRDNAAGDGGAHERAGNGTLFSHRRGQDQRLDLGDPRVAERARRPLLPFPRFLTTPQLRAAYTVDQMRICSAAG